MQDRRDSPGQLAIVVLLVLSALLACQALQVRRELAETREQLALWALSGQPVPPVWPVRRVRPAPRVRPDPLDLPGL